MEDYKMSDLYDLVKSACEELQEWIDENPGDDEPHDRIFEIADSHVPVYNSDIIQCAADNISLAVDEPELGPAFDGSPTPINIIAANIFEYIEAELWEYYNDHKDDGLDSEEEEIEVDEV
jgi:hypothetical protein